MVNHIKKSDLQEISRNILKGLNLVRENSTHRRRYNEAFPKVDDRHYIRTIRTRMLKWGKTSYPCDFCCRCKENKRLLIEVSKFFKEARV